MYVCLMPFWLSCVSIPVGPIWPCYALCPIWIMVLKTKGLNPGFQCKNWFWKTFTMYWDIGQNVSEFSFSSKMSISYHFCPMHIFPNRFLHWNPGFKPVILSTIHPIIKRSFSRTYKGVPEFKNIQKIAVRVLQRKIWNIPHVQNIKWFHFSLPVINFLEKMIFTP